MISTSASAGDFACRIKAGNWFACNVKHLTIQVCLQPAHRLSGEDMQTNRDQRTIRRIKDLVWFGHANDSVAQIPAGVVNALDLCVL